MNKKRRRLQEEKPDYAAKALSRDQNGKYKHPKNSGAPSVDFNPTYNEPHELLNNSIRSPRSQLSDIPEEPIHELTSPQPNGP